MESAQNPAAVNDRPQTSPGPEDARVRYAAAMLLDASDASRFVWPEWLAYSRPDDWHGQRGVCIVPSGFFGSDYGRSGSLPRCPLARFEELPLLYGRPEIRRQHDRLFVEADLLASAYFLLTRYEEWVRPEVRDSDGRFPGTASLPFRERFLERPLVDEYAALLRRLAREVGIDWPSPVRRFSVLLTHDVDTVGVPQNPLQALRSLASAVRGRTPWPAAIADVRSSLGIVRDPCDNLPEVIRMDRQLTGRFPAEQCRSIFFLLGREPRLLEPLFSLQSRRGRRTVADLLREGVEIGLHPSYAAGARPEAIGQERALLERATGRQISKSRHHYLRWCEPEHGHTIAAAGIAWDSTLGYADAAGFRLGVCRPVPLFDPHRRCLLGIEEHPLIVMDCTLSDPDLMGLDEEQAFDCVRRLAAATRRHEGEFVILWHNSRVAEGVPGYHRRLYRRVLDHLEDLLAQPCAGQA